MNRIITLTVFCLALAIPGHAELVCSVHDGDTIKLCDGRSIRFKGIDAPELHQPLGTQSRDFLAALVQGQKVKLNCTGKSYNRYVCRVWYRNQDVESIMVSHGWAFDYPKFSYGQYAQAESFARQSGVGVWLQPGGGVRPWNWRHR